MPANPRQLYNELKKLGEISVSYEDFRSKWDEPGWNVDFYKALRKKEFTSLSYEDFIFTFSDKDPEYNPPGTITLSEKDLEGKDQVEPYPQLGPAVDTELPGANISWASPEKIANIQKQFGGISPAELENPSITEEEVDGLNDYITRLNKKPIQKIATPEKIANIQKAFGSPQEQERAKLSLQQIEDISNYVEELPGEDYDFNKPKSVVERGLDSFLINMPLGLEIAWESSKAAVTHLYAKSQNNLPWGTITTLKANEYLKSQLTKVQKLQGQMEEVGGIVKGVEEGDAKEIWGGVFNATQGVLSTVIPAMMTGGGSLIPQVMAPVWTDYQITKANAKYGDTSDPIAALIDSNDVDNVVPLTLGAGAVVLEKIGFKGISKYIAGTGVGQKVMGIPTNAVAWLLTANKEGMTELGQLGLETINTEVAAGKTWEQALEKGVETMFSKDGLENYLQGMVGSGIMTGPTAINTTLTRALHEDPDGHKMITAGIDAISELKERRLLAKSKTVRDLYDKDINSIESAIKQTLKANNKLIKHLSPSEQKTLISTLNKKDKITKDLKALDKAVVDGEITAKEAGYGKRRLNAQNIALSEDIAALKANIDKSKTYQDIKTVKKLAKKIEGMEVASFESSEGVKEYLSDKTKSSGEVFTDVEIARYSDTNGFIWTDDDGMEHIVINEDVAVQEKRTTTGQHEFLHKVLAKTLANDSNLAEKLGNKLDVHLKAVLGDDFQNTEYAQRAQDYVKSAQEEIGAVKKFVAKKIAEGASALEAGAWTLEEFQRVEKSYNELLDTKIKEEVAIISEEKLTLLSEALTNGDITLNTENRNFLEKIGEVLRRFAQKLGLTDVRLDTGEDVVRFIKDYNRGFERGKLSKSITKFTKGLKTPSKTPTGKLKQSKADSKIDLYEKTAQLYADNDKHTAGFLIAMEWENQIKSLARKYKNLPGYTANIEDLVASVMTANQGVVGLVKSFKPGTKATDGENEVALAGWINKFLPNYVNSALHKHGIGVVEEQGGFAVDVTDQKDLTSEEEADDLITTEETATVQEKRKYLKMKDALKLEKYPSLREYIENRISLNISGAIKLYGKAKSINTKSDAFVQAVKKGVQDDEKSKRVMRKHIQDYGYEQFLVDQKVSILGNYTTTILAKHPFYRQAIQKRIKGVWKSPEAVVLNGKTKYEYLMEDGKIYPARHPDFDRDSAAKTGHTSGHFKIRRHPNAANAISTNAFVDYHFTDGAGRKFAKANPLESISMQFTSEVGFELLEEQLLSREGNIFDAFQSRVQLTEEMTVEQKEHALAQGLLIRDGMAAVLTDRGIAETLKDLDRGGIKESKVNKTGFNWFDRPRIDMTNYLAALENNEVREGVVNGVIKSPDYEELHGVLHEAYDMYLGMLEYKDTWNGTLKKYAEAFEGNKFENFEAFVNSTLDQTTASIEGMLGLQAQELSFTKRNWVTRGITRDEGVQFYIQQQLSGLTGDKKNERFAEMVKLFVGATSGAVDTALFINTPGFFKDLIGTMPYQSNVTGFKLIEVEGGTTITYKDKKITTDFSRGVFSEDVFDVFGELAEGGDTITSTIDVKGRIEEAEKSGKLYLEYVEWLRDNHSILSPTTIGMMLKGFQARGRSVAHIMHPITNVALFKDSPEITEYTTIPSIPAKYVSQVALNYILTGKNKKELTRVIKEGTTSILLKAQAKVVDQFHHNTSSNDFNSVSVKNKLYELGLPKISTTNLIDAEFIPLVNAEAIKESIRFNKTINGGKESLKYSKPSKGISVWDFDDTLAKTNSKVIYTDLQGKTQKITPAQFAEIGDALMEQGIEFDFSEFSKVVKGKKGPLFDVAVKRNEKFGNEHVYILTARPQASAHAIHTFLKGIGLDIRLENITGLQNGDPQAKADWIMGKVGEGYNDFYFADDHIGNVKAVADILKDIDVKSDIVRAKVKTSLALDKEFNQMLERTTGVDGIAKKQVKAAEGHLSGRDYDRTAKARLRLFVPPSAEDFVGLLYKFMGKGEQGNLDKGWLMTHLVDPYLKGVDKLDIMNTAINRAYNKLMREHPVVRRKLHNKVPGTNYTYDMAIRYYLYERSGFGDLLGDSVGAKDGLTLMKTVMLDKQLVSFANALSAASQQPEGYAKPDGENWLIQSIATDFKGFISNTHRAAMLQEFIDNTDEVFSKENLNKIESLYGTKYRRALEGSIGRMKSGTKNLPGGDSNMRKFSNWVTGAIAPIMFLNQRSAILQLLSIPNFINWSDNNPAMVAKAFANPKQFWGDFQTIYNSPKMVQRRNGLRFSIEEAELANLGGSEGVWGVFMKRVIKLGFTPTQISDGFAIAFGGAPMYRNRLNTYKRMIGADGKKLYTEKQATDMAWKDFAKISDEAQQSSDQMLTSSEQAGGLGRIILAFANTPAQYTRLIKKAASDIKNGRGDLKTNISKIAYYGALQNFVFTALQTALFSVLFGFGGEDDEGLDEDQLKALDALRGEKGERVFNGMLDTVLRGMGVRGAALATVKNTLMSYSQQREKPMPNFAQPIITALSISPPLGSKARDLNRMMTNEKYSKDIIENKGWAWDSPRWLTLGLGIKVALNLPGDYIPKKIEIGKAIASDEGTLPQDAMLGLGWSPYDLGMSNKEFEQIKAEAKADRADLAKERRKDKSVLTKLEKQAALDARTPQEIKRDSILKVEKRKKTTAKAAATRAKNKEAKDRAIWEEARKAARTKQKN